jgi:hypothetical protein
MAVHGWLILRVVPRGRVKRFFSLLSYFHCISVGVVDLGRKAVVADVCTFFVHPL